MLMDTFQQYLLEDGSARRTVEGYVRDLRIFSQWFEESNGEAFTPEGLTAIDVRLYRQHLQANKAEASTINRRLAALRKFGAMLKACGLAAANPAEGVKGVEKQKMAPKWLDRKQQGALLRRLELQIHGAKTEAWKRQAIRDRAAVVLILNTGLRVSELCALELADLEVNERSGMVHVRKGKGEKARSIPLNRSARAALRLWLEIREGQGGRMLMVGKRGEGMTSSGFERRLKEVCRLAGVDATPHELRHSFAKNLIDAGVSIETVAALLGHSRLETTRLYIVPGVHDLTSAVRALDL